MKKIYIATAILIAVAVTENCRKLQINAGRQAAPQVKGSVI